MMTLYVFKTLFPDQVTEFAMIDKTTYYEVTFCKVRTLITSKTPYMAITSEAW